MTDDNRHCPGRVAVRITDHDKECAQSAEATTALLATWFADITRERDLVARSNQILVHQLEAAHSWINRLTAMIACERGDRATISADAILAAVQTHIDDEGGLTIEALYAILIKHGARP